MLAEAFETHDAAPSVKTKAGLLAPTLGPAAEHLKGCMHDLDKSLKTLSSMRVATSSYAVCWPAGLLDSFSDEEVSKATLPMREVCGTILCITAAFRELKQGKKNKKVETREQLVAAAKKTMQAMGFQPDARARRLIDAQKTLHETAAKSAKVS